MPRPRKVRLVGRVPIVTCFKPRGVPMDDLKTMVLPVDALEALRLSDAMSLEHDEAARRMGVSRPTFSRLLTEARHAVATALTEGWALRVEGGDFQTADGVGNEGESCRRRRPPAPTPRLEPQGKDNMITHSVVAFPCSAPGGLNAFLSPHFGHCEAYTLVTLGENGPTKIEVISNSDHEEGNCGGPVRLLADAGAKTLVSGGMGRGPLSAFLAAGIEVHHAGDAATVAEGIAALAAGRLPRFTLENTCGGGCSH